MDPTAFVALWFPAGSCLLKLNKELLYVRELFKNQPGLAIVDKNPKV